MLFDRLSISHLINYPNICRKKTLLRISLNKFYFNFDFIY